MDPATIITVAIAMVKGIKVLIETGQQLFGKDKIPTFEEILDLNTQGQDAIDAEMKRRGLK
jgi:hypothetical protein